METFCGGNRTESRLNPNSFVPVSNLRKEILWFIFFINHTSDIYGSQGQYWSIVKKNKLLSYS